MIQEVKTHDPIVPNVSIWFDLGVFLKFLGIEVTKNNYNVQGFIFFTQFSENQSQVYGLCLICGISASISFCNFSFS